MSQLTSISDCNGCFMNGILYITTQIPKNSLIEADDITVLTENENYGIDTSLALSTITDKNGEEYSGRILNQDRNFVTFTNYEDDANITIEFEKITTEIYNTYTISSTEAKFLKVRLEYQDRFFYEIKGDLKKNNKISILKQQIILKSKLPIDLENIKSFRLNFKNEEFGMRKQSASLMRTSNETRSSPIVVSDEVGLPLELGEIDSILNESETRIALTETKLTKQRDYFLYSLDNMYCSAETLYKVDKGNIYPGTVAIVDEFDLPLSFVNLTLQKEGNVFPINFGRYPGITIEVVRNKDTITLKVNSNLDMFNLVVKSSYQLDKDYEFVINKTANLTLNKKKEKEIF